MKALLTGHGPPAGLSSWRGRGGRRAQSGSQPAAWRTASPELTDDAPLTELSVGLVDRHLTTMKTKHGSAMAKQTRSVLSGVCGLACRLDAMESNPCRETTRLSTKPKKPPAALDLASARQLMAYLTYDDKSIGRDLPDFVSFMLATGLRIGEAAAVTLDCVDLDAGTVDVRGTVLRLTGKGLIIKLSPKSAAGERILELPLDVLKIVTNMLSDAEPASPVTAPSLGLHGRRSAELPSRSSPIDASTASPGTSASELLRAHPSPCCLDSDADDDVVQAVVGAFDHG